MLEHLEAALFQAPVYLHVCALAYVSRCMQYVGGCMRRRGALKLGKACALCQSRISTQALGLGHALTYTIAY